MILIKDDLQSLVKILNNESDWAYPFVLIDKIAFEFSNILEDEIYLVDSSVYYQLSVEMPDKLALLQTVVLFYSSYDEIRKLEKFVNSSINLNSLTYFFDKNVLNENLFKTLILKQLNYLKKFFLEQQIIKSDLLSLNQEMNKTFSTVEEELLKVKKIHHSQIPRRLLRLPGMIFTSKYTAGERMGGEYHDYFSAGHKHFVFISRVSSYLASSIILNRVEEFKKNTINSNSLMNLISNLDYELKTLSHNKKRHIEFDYCAILFDDHKRTFELKFKGDFLMYSDLHKFNLLKKDKGELEYDISEPQRIIITSPGFNYNWRTGNRKELLQYLKNYDLNELELLDELFFEIKKEKLDDLLGDDATAVFMEIQEHGTLHIV